MNVKKLLCIILALALTLALAACGGEGDLGGAIDDKLNEGSTGGTGDTGDTDDGGDDGDSDYTPPTVDYSLYSKGLDENGFFEGVTAKDIVTLPDYSNVEMPTTVEQEDIDALINGALSNSADPIQVMDRAIVDGDTVNIDYVGSVDGVEFDGGSTGGNGTQVTIGVTSYIDDFLEQLIGHKPGENFDIEVTFPDPYSSNPDLAGKDAVFNITVNYICEWELNDESAKALGFDSADEVLEAAEAQLLSEARAQVQNDLLSQSVCEEIPQSVLDAIHNFNVLYYTETAAMYGVDLETFVTVMYGFSDQAAFEEELAETDSQMALTLLAAQALAETEGLEVTVDDIRDSTAESAVEQYGEPYVKFSLLNSLVIPEFLAGER